MGNRLLGGALVAMLAGAPGVSAQAIPEDLARERSEFAQWLRDAATSPYRAVGQHPIGTGITLGPPDSDVPLPGVGRARLEERGAGLSLTVDGASRPIARDRPVALGSHQLLLTGPPGRTVAAVFRAAASGLKPPIHFPYQTGWRLTVALVLPGKPVTQRLLAADGTEVEATEAGTVTIPAGDRKVTLRVFRIPSPGGEESDLEIYFRDGTNGKGSYPAGRFVDLVPAAGGRYLLDFNRARQPFCGYSSVYPCPAPWRGNTVPVPVPAGERYAGGGLELKAPPGDR